MGSLPRTKDTDWAYIAGFLDGDGSITVQVKDRSDSKRGWRFMFTVCFYQDTRHEEPLLWIRDMLDIGYLSRRNDGITELKVNGYEAVERVLRSVQPYAKFKHRQVESTLQLIGILKGQDFDQLPYGTREHAVELLERTREANYAAHRRKFTIAQLRKLLLFRDDPVTTEVKRPR